VARRVLLRRVVCSFGCEIALPAQLLRTGANTLRFAGRKEEEAASVILYLYTWITAAKHVVCTGRTLALYSLPILSVCGFADGVATHSVFAGARCTGRSTS
jgi:hypothetical protein